MSLEQKINLYKDYRSKMQALGYASYIISWDSETEAPVGCFEERSKQIGVLSEMSYSLERSEEYIDAVKYLFENLENLDDLLKEYLRLLERWKITTPNRADYYIKIESHLKRIQNESKQKCWKHNGDK